MKKMRIAGWVMSALVSAFMIFGSASGKFVEWEGRQQLFDHLGYSAQTIFAIGIVEVTVALLFLLPRIEIFGVILLTAYLGGAVATHVRVGDPFFFPIIIGVLAWTGFALRNERFRNYLQTSVKK